MGHTTFCSILSTIHAWTCSSSINLLSTMICYIVLYTPLESITEKRIPFPTLLCNSQLNGLPVTCSTSFSKRFSYIQWHCSSLHSSIDTHSLPFTIMHGTWTTYMSHDHDEERMIISEQRIKDLTYKG